LISSGEHPVVSATYQLLISKAQLPPIITFGSLESNSHKLLHIPELVEYGASDLQHARRGRSLGQVVADANLTAKAKRVLSRAALIMVEI
jgi:hypothetical protein